MSSDLNKVLCPPDLADICLLQLLELQTLLVLVFLLQRTVRPKLTT